MPKIGGPAARVAAINARKADTFAPLLNIEPEMGTRIPARAIPGRSFGAPEVDDPRHPDHRQQGRRPAISGKQTENGNVRGFVRKWRARNDSNVRPSDS